MARQRKVQYGERDAGDCCRQLNPMTDLQSHQKVPACLADILHPPDGIYRQVQTTHDGWRQKVDDAFLRFLALKVVRIPQIVVRQGMNNVGIGQVRMHHRLVFTPAKVDTSTPLFDGSGTRRLDELDVAPRLRRSGDCVRIVECQKTVRSSVS